MPDFLLSFAGIPFVSDVGLPICKDVPGIEPSSPLYKQKPKTDLIDELNRLINMNYLQDFAIPGTFPGKNLTGIAAKSTADPYPNPQIRIGDWYYPPTASRFSVFRGLATSTQANAMLNATETTLTTLPPGFQFNATSPARLFEIKAVPQGTNVASSYYSLSSYMHMLPPRPLAEHGGSYDGLYLITLVDERYYFQGSPFTYHIKYGTTWNDLLNFVSEQLGINLSYTTISPSFYSSPEPDSHLWTNLENAAALLDAIAYNVGRVVVRNLNGNYDLLTPAESYARVLANRGTAANVIRTAGGDIFNNNIDQALLGGDLRKARNVVVPATMYVTYPKYVFGDDPVPHFVNARFENPRQTSWVEDSYGDTYYIGVPISSGGSFTQGLEGTGVTTVHDTAKAIFSTEAKAGYDFPTNYNALVTMAMQVARDHYGSKVAAALDEVYPGTYAWSPEGFHDIIWTYSERSKQASTRVMQTMWNQLIAEFQHATPLTAGTQYNVKGVGGHSVAQTIRDTYSNFSNIISTNPQTGVNPLAYPLLLYDLVAGFTNVDNLPTNQRWKGLVDGEIILFDGTSGGITGGPVLTAASLTTSGSSLAADSYLTTNYTSFANGQLTLNAVRTPAGQAIFNGAQFFTAGTLINSLPTSPTGREWASMSSVTPATGGGLILNDVASGATFNPYYVTVACRGIDGTSPNNHLTAANVTYPGPNAAYGVNLTTYGRGQNVFPAEFTSGGITGLNVVPQTQSVQALSAVGGKINGINHFSGQVILHDPIDTTKIATEYVWLLERNNGSVEAEKYYDGMFVGYSATQRDPDSNAIIGNTAPVYVIDATAGGLTVQDTRYCTALTSGCVIGANLVAVQSITAFPNPTTQGGFLINIDNEEMFVTSYAPNATANVWNVVRSINGVSENHSNYAKVCWVLPTVSTTLNQNMTDTDVAMLVNSRRNFPTHGRFYILVDSEIILVVNQRLFSTSSSSSSSSSSSTNDPPDNAVWRWSLVRGVKGTTATAHLQGTAAVFHKFPDSVDNVQKILFDDSAFVQPGVPTETAIGEAGDVGIAVHHEVTQPIRIVSSTPNSSGLYDAYLQKWDSYTMRWKDDIKIWAIDMNA